MLANTHLDRFRRKTPFRPREFLPPDLRHELAGEISGSLTVDDMETFL